MEVNEVAGLPSDSSSRTTRGSAAYRKLGGRQEVVALDSGQASGDFFFDRQETQGPRQARGGGHDDRGRV